MTYPARLAMWLYSAAYYWPIRAQRLHFQLHVMGVAFDMYLQDARNDEAAALIPQYLRLSQEVEGTNPDGLAGAVFMSRRADFGRILFLTGGKETALRLVQQSDAWFKLHPAEANAVWGTCLLKLGGALVQLQRPQEGIDWIEQAKVISERVLGPNSYEVAQCHNDLGIAFQCLGQLDAAERAQREALRLHEMAETHGRGVALALSNLSATLNKAGRLDEARQLSLRAVELVRSDEDVLGDMLDTLADHYEAQGKSEDALATRANALSLAISQNKSAKVAEWGTKQAALMDRMGQTIEAAKCRETMERIRRQVLDEQIPQV